MKNSQTSRFDEISSFEDFRLEIERQKLKRHLIEAKLSLDFSRITRLFSISNLIISYAKEYLLPRITDFIGIFLKNTEPGENA
jgi:hypothetical protein